MAVLATVFDRVAERNLDARRRRGFSGGRHINSQCSQTMFIRSRLGIGDMFDEEELREIRSAKADWEEESVEPTVGRFGERKDEFTTDTGGHTVNRLYTPADLEDFDYEEDLGFPGEAPYTRGVYSTGYR